MRAVAECYSLDVKFLSHTHVFEQLERLCWEMVAPLGGGTSLEEEVVLWRVLPEVYSLSPVPAF